MASRDKKITQTFSPVIYFVAVLWVVEAVNVVTGHSLICWGIYPRTMEGLMGIPLSPFIHGSIMHLVLNTGPLIVLGGVIVLYGKWIFVHTSLIIIIILISGLGLWIVGQPSYHVGASGLIFGYFGFLVAGGILKKSFSAILVSLITLVTYGSLIWGLLPTLTRVS